MPNPQQPELRRSEKGATTDDSLKGYLTNEQSPDADADAGAVPEANQPGHRPDVDQDKPSGDDFVRRARGEE